MAGISACRVLVVECTTMNSWGISVLNNNLERWNLVPRE